MKFSEISYIIKEECKVYQELYYIIGRHVVTLTRGLQHLNRFCYSKGVVS